MNALQPIGATDLRVRDLRAALDEVRGIFVSAGARAQVKTLSDVSDRLAAFDDDDLAAYLQLVRESGLAATASIEDKYVKSLVNAGRDEPRFLAVIGELSSDKKLKKSGLQKIAKKLDVSIGRSATAPQIVDAIKRWFYKNTYEQDAQELARRAKPV